MSLLQISAWIDVAVTIATVFFLMFLRYYIYYFFIAVRKTKKFEEAKDYYKFGILIPARNESKVIRNILESFKKIDYPTDKFEVFVIVETEDDPTVEIVREFGFKTIVRGDLTNRRTKGFALDDAYKYIKANNLHFDAYMIFDADNVVSSNYLKLMNDVKHQGYQIGVGYRSFTNATKNWVCSTSATLFSFMNQFTSKGRSHLFEKATLTGTGYYIDSEIVDDAGGWIWNGMTEDVELTNYCYYHNIRMIYYPYARYFDEQPEDMKTLHKQHIRWVWGFIKNKDRFKKGGKFYPVKSKVKRRISIIEYCTSIFPFLIMALTLLVSAFATLLISIVSGFVEPTSSAYIFAHSVYQFSLIYVLFMFVASFTLAVDNKNLKFNVKQSVVIVLTYMFFFADFLFAFFDGLFHKKKRTLWKEIEHKGIIVDKEALESNSNVKEG